MTITAVSFVPCAPLLVPEVAGGAAALDDDLREASLDVTKRLLDADVVVVVAPAEQPGSWDGETTWSFAGFGVQRPGVDAAAALQWPLGIGAWLLDAAGWDGARRYLGVTPDESKASVPAGRVAVLAVGDGSARRTEKAPGHLDDRAAGFDATIAAALATGDLSTLHDLDPVLAADLMCAGAPVWRWIAAAVGDARPSAAELLVDDARYGVAYFVAAWTFA